MTEKIATFLSDQLEKRNMTKYEVSQLTEIDRTSLGRIYSGEREPGIINFMKICKAMKVSKNDLYDLLKNF
jgi:predicted transcriptional regulator